VPVEYEKYYDLETYLFAEVGPRFAAQGALNPFDFFCIIIWKANRSKSIIARRLLRGGHTSLDVAVHDLTSGIAAQPDPKHRLLYLLETWGFRLPIASAILTVLYPTEFTVYDVRVCEALGAFHRLSDIADPEKLWLAYLQFIKAVTAAAPSDLSLRDKDRYLWGLSFYNQLQNDLQQGFRRD
jgi:hypothetical protein